MHHISTLVNKYTDTPLRAHTHTHTHTCPYLEGIKVLLAQLRDDAGEELGDLLVLRLPLDDVRVGLDAGLHLRGLEVDHGTVCE
jgi:hypothetical protein